MRLVQGALLGLYSGVQRSGLLKTAPGRWAFENAYWAYKATIEARDLAALRPYVSAGSTVVDVGANIGFFSVRFAQWAGPGGCVVAIEPETGNYESLRARVARRGLQDRVVLVNAAAVEAPGEVFLQLNPDNPADHRVANAGEAVKAVSIDSVMEGRKGADVSLIKVDVQGGELRVIRGARATIARAHPALFVEFQEEGLVMAGTSSAELLRELTALGYVPNVLEPDSTWKQVDGEEVFARMRTRGYIDVLFLVPTATPSSPAR